MTASDRETLKVAVCQLTSVDDVGKNLEQILNILRTLETDVPDLVCFPENALFLRVREGTPIPGLELNHPAILEIAAWATKFGASVHLGSVPLRSGGRVYNASVLCESDGGVRDSYQKIHLFDVDVEGARPMRESDAFAAGADTSVLEIKGWKIGSSICYDLRFAELFLRYAKLEVDAILIPSAFLVPTGRAHWEILTRARAIESQAYVLAAAQGGTHAGLQGGTRSTYGHSIVVDPWGVVLAETPQEFSEGQRILRVVLDRRRINEVRRQIPMSSHRRLS